MKKVLFFLIFLLSGTMVQARIWLPSILSDNMVLQQNSVSNIWGWSTSTDETITVLASWSTEPVQGKADQGKWSISLSTPRAGGPFQITIVGHETIVLKNVMIGEVWICSGQSNMEWSPLQGLVNAGEEIQNAHHPRIRFFFLPRHKAETPQEDTPGRWEVCTPETMQHFSSVAYFFGRKLKEELDIPVGLVNTSWGGTPVETWIKKETLEAVPELKEAAAKVQRFVWWPNQAGVTYNAMIHPLIQLDIAGAIWYQGESNLVNGQSYYQSFPLLIDSWRKDWGKDFPFYFVQLAPFKYDPQKPLAAAVVRDAQLHTMSTVPNTGMVVTNDIGDLEDIHPTNKQDVGHRLALWALAKTYGVKDLVYSGPVYESMEIKDNKIMLHFKHTGKGLMMKGDRLREFLIAGEDKQFHPAEARINGSMVEVTSTQVSKPVAVRFAFSNIAQPNLFNSAGLPASAFRTDKWEIRN